MMRTGTGDGEHIPEPHEVSTDVNTVRKNRPNLLNPVHTDG